MDNVIVTMSLMVPSFPSISAFSLIAKDDRRLKSVLLASEPLLEHDGESYPSSCIFEKLLASLNFRSNTIFIQLYLPEYPSIL